MLVHHLSNFEFYAFLNNNLIQRLFTSYALEGYMLKKTCYIIGVYIGKSQHEEKDKYGQTTP